jgi:hypothetical protein
MVRSGEKPEKQALLQLRYSPESDRFSSGPQAECRFAAFVWLLASALMFSARTGSVYLNNAWAFPEGIPPLVKPLLGLMAAR